MDGEAARHAGPRQFWKHVVSAENFWESLQEIEPGTVAKLAALASSRRWEIIFLTKRPASAGATAQVQTQRWLQKHGFALPSVYVVQGSRGLIAAALHLDIVVDDRPENCVDIALDSRARPVLVWRAPPQDMPAGLAKLNVTVVSSMEECLALLDQAEVPTTRRGGVLAAVKKLFGRSAP
jgi:hypothetical protein